MDGAEVAKSCVGTFVGTFQNPKIETRYLCGFQPFPLSLSEGPTAELKSSHEAPKQRFPL
jgi:hypothetical protein